LLSLSHLLTSLHNLGLLFILFRSITQRLQLQLLWAKHASTRARLHDSRTASRTLSLLPRLLIEAAHTLSLTSFHKAICSSALAISKSLIVALPDACI
jgi:hypothetical protein